MGYYSKKINAKYLDLHDQEELVVEPSELSQSSHLTEVLQSKADQIIRNHALSFLEFPLFMYYAPQNVHDGNIEGLEAPDDFKAKCLVDKLLSPGIDKEFIGKETEYCALVTF